ncbi:hypothetical protein [Amycolatopsis aidingensis]|uniref:hypothetical protein n=1 Tax=Amycolatopsis aidingensis TaxID=2842453 RepID=UPI001C0AFE94|nr:hypothetical protein [Amycolatopsis aidingensis]
MVRKIVGMFAGVVAVVGLAAVPASASDHPPPGCHAFRYGFSYGQGISVNCYHVPYPPYSYRVVAHCSSILSSWYARGNWTEVGFGPSVAECHGGLLSSARVANYHVDVM